MIKIQKQKFSCEKVINQIKSNIKIGAIVSFQGYVRDFDNSKNDNILELNIEHYDGMTQKAIERIELLARKKWRLEEIVIIHRFGRLTINDLIVLVVVASAHRGEAFEACRYIIDSLKIHVPFWKKEISEKKSKWVKQKKSDLLRPNLSN